MQRAGVTIEATGSACDQSLTNNRLEVTVVNAVSCCSAVQSGELKKNKKIHIIKEELSTEMCVSTIKFIFSPLLKMEQFSYWECCNCKCRVYVSVCDN